MWPFKVLVWMICESPVASKSHSLSQALSLAVSFNCLWNRPHKRCVDLKKALFLNSVSHTLCLHFYLFGKGPHKDALTYSRATLFLSLPHMVIMSRRPLSLSLSLTIIVIVSGLEDLIERWPINWLNTCFDLTPPYPRPLLCYPLAPKVSNLQPMPILLQHVKL